MFLLGLIIDLITIIIYNDIIDLEDEAGVPHLIDDVIKMEVLWKDTICS